MNRVTRDPISDSRQRQDDDDRIPDRRSRGGDDRGGPWVVAGAPRDPDKGDQVPVRHGLALVPGAIPSLSPSWATAPSTWSSPPDGSSTSSWRGRTPRSS